jgi:hypothetical protein
VSDAEPADGAGSADFGLGRPPWARCGQPCPIQVARSTSLPSGSASVHHVGANRSLTSVPPAPNAAATRACARSCGTPTSTWIRLRSVRLASICWTKTGGRGDLSRQSEVHVRQGPLRSRDQPDLQHAGPQVQIGMVPGVLGEPCDLLDQPHPGGEVPGAVQRERDRQQDAPVVDARGAVELLRCDALCHDRHANAAAGVARSRARSTIRPCAGDVTQTDDSPGC